MNEEIKRSDLVNIGKFEQMILSETNKQNSFQKLYSFINDVRIDGLNALKLITLFALKWKDSFLPTAMIDSLKQKKLTSQQIQSIFIISKYVDNHEIDYSTSELTERRFLDIVCLDNQHVSPLETLFENFIMEQVKKESG